MAEKLLGLTTTVARHDACVLVTVFHPRWLNVIKLQKVQVSLPQWWASLFCHQSAGVDANCNLLKAAHCSHHNLPFYQLVYTTSNQKLTITKIYQLTCTVVMLWKLYVKIIKNKLITTLNRMHILLTSLKPCKNRLVVGCNGVICDLKTFRQIAKASQYRLWHHVCQGEDLPCDGGPAEIHGVNGHKGRCQQTCIHLRRRIWEQFEAL